MTCIKADLSKTKMQRGTNKRRSEYGTRRSLLPAQDASTNKKMFHVSVTDRIKYRCNMSSIEHDRTFHPDTLLLITRHSWTIYRASPLNKIEYRQAKLKNYAFRIKQELVKQIDDSDSNVTFSTKVVVLPDLMENINDSPSIQIEVFLIKEGKEPSLKYKGVLLSWGAGFDSEQSPTHLPLLLCVGAVNVTRIVHKTISDLFDTCLQPLHITEDDLMWLSAFLNGSTSRTRKEISFEYLLPNTTRKNSLTISCPSDLIARLWQEIHPPGADEVTFEQVYTFHKYLQAELKILYSLNFENLKLNKISLTDAIIECKGKMRIHTEETASIIMNFLNDMTLFLESYCPKMSVQNSS